MKLIKVFFLLCCIQLSLEACSTPVFQYALERWEPEPYHLYIINNNKLSPDQNVKVQSIEKKFESFVSNSAIYVYTIVESGKIPEFISKQIKDKAQTTWPLAVLQFPETDQLPHPLLIEPLSELDVPALLSSPKRTELAKRLGGGHSCVWIVLKSEDEEKNKKVVKTLNDSFKEIIPILQKDINERLQGMDIDDSGGALDDGTLNVGIPKVHCSIMTLDRKNDQEALLIGMLTRLIPDVHNSKDTIAFPVYGRGRALWPMPSEDVTFDNIDSTLSFLCGSCSCQIKNDNPGYDLMICEDWDSIITDTYIGQTEMPELTGPTAHVDDIQNSEPTNELMNKPYIRDEEEKPALGLMLTIAAIVAFTVLILGTIRVFRHRD